MPKIAVQSCTSARTENGGRLSNCCAPQKPAADFLCRERIDIAHARHNSSHRSSSIVSVPAFGVVRHVFDGTLEDQHAMATMEEHFEQLSFQRPLALDYDKSKVPAGGAEVVASNASPLPGDGRMTAEPAGRKFHEKAMRVRGLITGTNGNHRTKDTETGTDRSSLEPPFRRRHFCFFDRRIQIDQIIDQPLFAYFLPIN